MLSTPLLVIFIILRKERMNTLKRTTNIIQRSILAAIILFLSFPGPNYTAAAPNADATGDIATQRIVPEKTSAGLSQVKLEESNLPQSQPTNSALVVEAEPYLVIDINPTGSSLPRYLTELNGKLFFFADDGSNGFELWRSDGTEAGTEMVANINDGSHNPGELTEVNSVLFFRADDSVHGEELWKSDGTEAGTVLVKDIRSGGGSYPDHLVNVNGTLFFTAYDSVSGIELWKSDGTEIGTVLVKDINPSGNSSPSSLTDVNGTLFFTANDSTHGVELWKSDGTEAGTLLVKDIRAGTGGSLPFDLINFNGMLFFVAFEMDNGDALWKSDGTENGTVMVKDTYEGGVTYGGPHPAQLTNVNGTLFFRGDDGSPHGRELWSSDGTTNGTAMVKDIYLGGGDSFPAELTDV
ncbi:MAG: hypothetical protein HN842_01130, partial [Gammaproteobacteria bacterium]|nr:hypothetical protein [Gammaproteobacteria bacterium]